MTRIAMPLIIVIMPVLSTCSLQPIQSVTSSEPAALPTANSSNPDPPVVETVPPPGAPVSLAGDPVSQNVISLKWLDNADTQKGTAQRSSRIVSYGDWQASQSVANLILMR